MKNFFFIIISIFLFSCKKDKDIKNINLGYNYYPVSVGDYIIYDVDSIVYDDFTGDTIYYNYQLKEYIESSFIDNEGRTSYRIERYFKQNNDTAKWELHDVWYITPTKKRIEKVEENIRYIKLIFPVEKNQTWNGNALNILPYQEYKYSTVDIPQNIGTFQFDSTLTVIQLDENNLIEKKYYQESYARNIGLIYKRIIDLTTDVDSSIVSGIDYTQTIISYKIQ